MRVYAEAWVVVRALGGESGRLEDDAVGGFEADVVVKEGACGVKRHRSSDCRVGSRRP